MNLRLLLLQGCVSFGVIGIGQNEINWSVLADAEFNRVLVKEYNSVL